MILQSWEEREKRDEGEVELAGVSEHHDEELPGEGLPDVGLLGEVSGVVVVDEIPLGWDTAEQAKTSRQEAFLEDEA